MTETISSEKKNPVGRGAQSDKPDVWHAMLTDSSGPADFVQRWLLMVAQITDAQHAVIAYKKGASEGVRILVSEPSFDTESQTPLWLSLAFHHLQEAAGFEKPTLLRDEQEFYASKSMNEQVLIVPITLQEQPMAVILVFPVQKMLNNEARMVKALEAGIRLYEYYHRTEQNLAAAERLTRITRIHTELQRQKHFKAVAMSLCNQMAIGFDLERATLGVLKGKHLALEAMDHTEKFSRKMSLVQQIEETMEECLDQEMVIAYPAEQAPYVSRQAKLLCEQQASAQVLSIPLVDHDGTTRMVLTLEASANAPIHQDSLPVLQLFAQLLGPWLLERYDASRFFLVRAGHRMNVGVAWLLGAKHTWLKLLAISIMGFLLFACFVEGNFVIELPASVESRSARFITAPTNGILASVEVVPGDYVSAGTVLARMDESDLLKERASFLADRHARETEAAIARREHRIAEQKIAEARSSQITARLEQLDFRIGRMHILAPVEGYVVSENLQQQVGRNLNAGEPLFKIVEGSPPTKTGEAGALSMRLVLQAREDDVHFLHVDQPVGLVLTSQPDLTIHGTLRRIHPTAQTVLNPNVRDNTFEIWAYIESPPTWMRPGMQGEAEIIVAPKSYAWIWTRRVRNWIGMKLWEWF